MKVSVIREAGHKPVCRLAFWVLACSLLLVSPAVSQTENLPGRPLNVREGSNGGALWGQSPRNAALGYPSFTDLRLFNAYDFSGYTLGLLEREQEGLYGQVGFLHAGQAGAGSGIDRSSNLLYLPQFGYTSAGKVSSRFYYQRAGQALEGEGETQMVLHHMGVDLALSAASQFFQFGLSFHFSMGGVEDTMGNERTLIHIRKLDAEFGSAPHALTRFGFHIGGSGGLDSLMPGDNNTFERIGELELPNWGLFFDFGDLSVLPVLANAKVNFHTLRQIGTYKSGNVESQYNPRWTSQGEFDLQGMAVLEKNGMTYRPAATFGFWSATTERYRFDPTDKNDPYLERGKCIDGELCTTPGSPGSIYTLDGADHDWTFSGVQFGLGLNADVLGYADGFLEWKLRTLNFEANSGDDDQLLNRYLLGMEVPLQSMVSLPQPLEIFIRLSHSWGRDNEYLSAFSPNQYYFPRYTKNLPGRTLTSSSPYAPELGTSYDWRTTNLGLGFLAHKRFGADLFMGFYGTREPTDDYGGFDIGINASMRL